MSGFAAEYEHYLRPGEVYFGDNGETIRTLLGSCVAITLWHPQLRIGGMCHFVLPGRGSEISKTLDGRFGDEALEILLAAARKRDTDPRDYVVKIFGGGNMFPHLAHFSSMDLTPVGDRNIETAEECLRRHGLRITRRHVGEVGYRILLFELATGEVWLKHQRLGAPPDSG